MSLWIDCEVHVLPPDWCHPSWRPPETEDVLIRVLYDHPERDLALAGASGEGLLAEMERAGIDQAVITGLPWRAAPLNWRNTAYVAELARAHPGRFHPVGLLPAPDTDDPVRAVRRIAEEFGCKGVKVIPSWQGWRLDDPRLDDCWEAMRELGLFLMTHTDQPYRDIASSDPPQALFAVAARHPRLRILAPHLGGGLAQAALHAPVATVMANTLFVASVPLTMRACRHALDAVGADQVCFGTDFPFNPSHDQARVKADLLALDLPPDDLAKVAGLTAARFLGEPA